MIHMPFSCNICEQESTRICVRCTKDTCGNHLCDKCRSCSDCCECDVPLSADYPEGHAVHLSPPHEPEPKPHPGPDPDPAPEPEPIPTLGFYRNTAWR